MGGSTGGAAGSRTTITTPNFGTVSLGKKATKQLAMADYQNTQNQQTIDKQTEANRVNQTTPWGSVTWNQGADGVWNQNTTLSPDQQAALDSQQRIQQGLSGTAEGMLNGIGSTYSNPMDWSGFDAAGKVATAPGMADYKQYGAGPDFQQAGPLDMNQLMQAGEVGPIGSASAGTFGGAQAKEYDLQKQLDMSNMPDMPVANENVRNQVSDALYQQMASRLDPQWQQREQQNLDRLYAMGAREGDALFGNQTDNLNRDRNDAYNQAMWQSIVGGGQEMERLFNMGLGARKQGWEETLGQGQFTNDALMNQFNQGYMNAGLRNAAGIASAQNQTSAGIANANNATSAAIASAGNRTNLANSGLDYGLRAADVNNRWGQQGWENTRTNADQWNALVNQAYGNERQQSQDLTAERERQISEALRQRNQPLNELTALLGGQQVQSPTFQGGPATTAGAADTANYYGAFTDNQARQAAAQAQQNQMISSLAGSAMGMFAFSDRRLKSNVVRVGSTISGIPVYEYDIFGHRERGVMADEVPSEWTAVHPSGYTMVDYARVW